MRALRLILRFSQFSWVCDLMATWPPLDYLILASIDSCTRVPTMAPWTLALWSWYDGLISWSWDVIKTITNKLSQVSQLVFSPLDYGYIVWDSFCVRLCLSWFPDQSYLLTPPAGVRPWLLGLQSFSFFRHTHITACTHWLLFFFLIFFPFN